MAAADIAVPRNRYRGPVGPDGQPMLYASAPVGDPVDGGDSGSSPWNPVYGNVGQPAGGLTGPYATSAPGVNLPALNTDPDQQIHTGFYQNQALEAAMNERINQEATQAADYHGQRQARADTAQDEALSQLKQTPGYTDEETAAIKGDPNAVRDVTEQGVNKEQSQLDEYGHNLSGQVGNYANYTKSGLDTLQGGLDKSQKGFSKLDEAVNNPDLAFDPNATEKQLTDQDVQAMRTAAGTRVGNQYRSAQDELQRRAAAGGNTSALALAAGRESLDAQSAAQMGDAEASADIQARQAQQDRAAQIEQQRQDAARTQTGYRASAATQEQSQAQNAAALAGTEKIKAGEAVGQAGINASNAYGQTAVQQQNTQTGQRTDAARTADNTTSARAGQVADTRIAGQGAYRSGIAQQQGLAQQGGQKAVDQQQAAASTLGNQLNTSTANRANYEVGGAGNSALNQATKVIGSIFAEGGMVTEPTVGVLAEKGPEVVIPMPRYRRNERMAA